MSDRSNKPSFAVSRNLKRAKYHFIEAITDKLTESSNTTPNSVSTSTWLRVTSNISTSHKTWQTSLLFLELLQIQNLKRKSGGTSYICPPTWKSGGHTSLRCKATMQTHWESTDCIGNNPETDLSFWKFRKSCVSYTFSMVDSYFFYCFPFQVVIRYWRNKLTTKTYLLCTTQVHVENCYAKRLRLWLPKAGPSSISHARKNIGRS